MAWFTKLWQWIKSFFVTPSLTRPVPVSEPRPETPRPTKPKVVGMLRYGTILGGDQSVLSCSAESDPSLGTVVYRWYNTQVDAWMDTGAVSSLPRYSPMVTLRAGKTWEVWLRWHQLGNPEPRLIRFVYTRSLDGSWPAEGEVSYPEP